jgi:hypothetical protein
MDGTVSNRGCLLNKNHKSYHLVKVSDGDYLLWYPLDECFCNQTPCECFTFQNITEVEAQKLLDDTVR